MVVRHDVRGGPVVWEIFISILAMELMLAWLWFIEIVAFVILVGWLLQGRRDEQWSHRSYCLKDRLLPDPLELFHQRQRKRLLIFKRGSRLS